MRNLLYAFLLAIPCLYSCSSELQTVRSPEIRPGRGVPDPGDGGYTIYLPEVTNKPRWLDAYDNVDYDKDRCLTCEIYNMFFGEEEYRPDGVDNRDPWEEESRLLRDMEREAELNRRAEKIRYRTIETYFNGGDVESVLTTDSRRKTEDFLRHYDGTPLFEGSREQIDGEANEATRRHNERVKEISNSVPNVDPPEVVEQEGRFITARTSEAGRKVRATAAYIRSVRLSVARNDGSVSDEKEKMLGLSESLVEHGDQALYEGKVEEGEKSLDLALEVADLTLSSIPVVSWGKDLYESVTGKNLLTGEELDKWDHAAAILGAVTLGVGSKLGKVDDVLRIANKVSGNKLDDVGNIFKSAEKLGIDESSDLQRVLGSRGKPKQIAADPDFTPPPKSVDQYGRLTDGKYTVSPQDQARHKVGSFDATDHTGRELPAGKSQFLYASEADEITLNAAAYADKTKSWDETGTKAKVVFDNPIGVHRGTGKVTNVVNVYRKQNGTIHGSPSSPQ